MTDRREGRLPLLSPIGQRARVEPGTGRVAKRLRAVASAPRWAYGMGLTSYRYGRRHVTGWAPRRQESRQLVRVPARLLDAARQAGVDVQHIDSGVGPFFHRRFTALVADPELDAAALIRAVLDDPNEESPTEVAVFDKTSGDDSGSRPSHEVGDTWVVHMPGPWEAPVQLVERQERAFAFATLQGHMEAGLIEFRARDHEGGLTFEIETFARSGDRLYDVIYDKLGLAREMQLHMWVYFCEQAARRAGGRLAEPVTVVTDRHVDQPVVPAGRPRRSS